MQKRLIFVLAGLVFTGQALAAGYSLPLPKKGTEYQQLEQLLSDRSLTKKLLNDQKLVSEEQARNIQQRWLSEKTGNPALDNYQRERQQRSELSNQLAQLRGIVDFDQVTGVENIISGIQANLQAEHAHFYLPIYLFSVLELPFTQENQRTVLLQTSRASYVTSNFGLEQLFSQQKITDGQLIKDLTRMTTSGRLELDASLNKCTLQNIEKSSSLTLEISKHRFYPFALDTRSHLQGSFVRQTEQATTAKITSLPLNTASGHAGQTFNQCDDAFNAQLQNQQAANDLQEKQQTLNQLAKKLATDHAHLAGLVRKVFANPYAGQCNNLACVAHNLNQPLETPEDWPKLVFLQVEGIHERVEAGLFFMQSYDLPEKLIAHLQTVRTSVSEEVNLGNFSSDKTQQLELARISKLTLVPYAGNNNKLGILARVELIAPSAELPKRIVNLGPYPLVFREVYLNDQPHWIAETSLSNKLLNYFLKENQQYQHNFLTNSCNRRGDLASCLTPRGLEWFLHWAGQQTNQQFTVPKCQAWTQYLESLDTSSCQSKEGQLQGLCDGVRDVCTAGESRFFAIGHCDTCGAPAKVSSKADPYFANPQNGIRLEIH